jgi:SNF2 family DNA or RNA helicase
VGLRSPLRPYQLLGTEWLLALWHYRLGGLLCDDMGLGKTHQAMALLLLLAEGPLTALPSLVVTPLTVLGHWQKKLAEHAPDPAGRGVPRSAYQR